MTLVRAGRRGVLAAAAAAILFGLAAPAAKPLAASLHPVMLAGLLYLGSGVGLGLVVASRRSIRSRLTRSELGWLAGAIVLGGVVGPVLLVAGLARITASSASLLLNAEAALTALLAWFLFREAYDRRIALGMGCIVAGAALLSGTGATEFVPSLLVLGACACWAFDNNLTRRVSHGDAIELAAAKGLVAGTTNVAVALMLGASLPAGVELAEAAAIGLLGYGASLALFIVGLRELGASRASAYFSLAPFVGAVTSVAVLGEPLSWQLGVAAMLMGTGAWLHLTEIHAHEHVHDPLEHSHEHEHDEHHPHGHEPRPPGRHSHAHRHDAIRHSHAHAPDIHHRHAHPATSDEDERGGDAPPASR